MAYSHSFSEEFFTGKQNIGDNLDFSIEKSQKPTSVIDSLIWCAKFEADWFKSVIKEYYPDLYKYMIHLNIDIDDNILYELLDKIREINTCDNLTVPVRVWITSDGWHTINIYDE